MRHEAATIPRLPEWPIVGSLPYVRGGRLALQLRLARQIGDVVGFRLPGREVVMTASPELAQQIFVEHADAFVKAPGLGVFAKPLLGEGLLTSEHELHARQRRMMAPMFVQRRIAAYADVMAARAEATQAALVDGALVDVGAAMMRLTLEIVAKTLFDTEVDGADAREVHEALTAAMEAIIALVDAPIRLPASAPSLAARKEKRAAARLDAIVYRIIAERRASGRDHGDLLSMLLAARDQDDGGTMTDRQVRDEAMTLFLAGHETTANAMAWLWWQLAQNPAAYDRLAREADEVLGARPATLDDLPKLPWALACLKESMRLYPPAYIVGRQAERDVELETSRGPLRIARGTIVTVNIYAMHRSPRWFEEPERFDPTRFLPEHEKKLPRHAYVPFGGGPRICIGNHFALMEGHLLAATFARAVRFELEPGVRVESEPLITLRPKGGTLRMRVRRRAR